jgi:nucleotide-binding universal stress UspA family protein
MTHHARFSRVVVPVDEVDHRAIAVATARGIADRLGAPLQLVTVVDESRPHRTTSPNLRDPDPFAVRHDVVVGADINREVERIAENPSTLVCLPTSAHTFVADQVTGAHATSITTHSQHPMLAIGPSCSPLFRGTQLAICVDGTAAGERIVRPSLDLANQLGLTPFLYQAIPIQVPMADARESSYVADLAQRFGGVDGDIQFDVLHDRTAARALTRLADEPDVAVLAMATGGLNPHDLWLVPSITRRVLRHARCPVFIGRRHPLPVPVDHGIGRRVVVGVDAGPLDDLVIEAAIREAYDRHARLEVVHAWSTVSASFEFAGLVNEGAGSVGARAAADLDDVLDRIRNRAPTIDVRGWCPERSAIDALLDASRGAEVVVVGEKQRNPVERWLDAPTTDDLVHHCTVPVLVVPTAVAAAPPRSAP